MDPFVGQVAEAIRRHRMFRRRERVLVAVSGGPDSVALLSALAALGVPVLAAHVNHRLRGRDSDADERFVRRLGARLGVEVVVLDGAVPDGSNLEERARDRRYEALRGVATARGCRRLATAHTRDDQAETVLLRLLRGAGGRGLGAMRPVRGDGLVRPILDRSREEVRAYLRRVGLRFRSDRSNRDLRFARNRVRRVLLPLLAREFNPAIRDALSRAAALLRDDEDRLCAEARRAARRVEVAGGLDARALERLPKALARRVVRFWIETECGARRDLEAAHVEAILGVAAGEAAAVSVRGGSVRREREVLCWRPPDRVRASPFRTSLEPGRPPVVIGEWALAARRRRGRRTTPTPWRAVFDADALGDVPLEASSMAPGARIRPFGLGGSRKLQDVFVDAKVPRHERAAWPIVTAGAIVLWVPGLVRSELAPVTGTTREVLVLEARRRRKTPYVAGKNPMCYGRTRRRVARGGVSSRRRRTSRKEPI